MLNVRWYLRYSLSYRDLAEMMLARGVRVDHTTIYRWVQAYSRGSYRGANKVERSHLRFASWRFTAGLFKTA
jgi:transposase-like protein